MSKGAGWMPAVTIRAGDRIIHHGRSSTVESVERIDTGPNYCITTEQGDFIAGAAQHIAFLQTGESHGNRDDHNDGPHGDPQQRRRRRAV